MKAHPTTYSFLAALALLVPGVLIAEDKPDAKAEAALAEVAGKKREATVLLTVKIAADRIQNFTGAFISKDGLALIDITALAWKEKPSVQVAGGTPLAFGTVLGIFPEQGLALMKFKHRPKECVLLAPEEPGVGESVAIIPLNRNAVWKDKIPPVIGLVLAKRTGLSLSHRVPQFSKIMSLGAGPSMTQRAGLGIGIFVVNPKGQLVAFFGGTQPTPSQILLSLDPVTSLSAEIGRLAKGGKALPRSEAHKHANLAIVDDDYHLMHIALDRRDHAGARARLKILLERHPNNVDLMILASGPALTDPLNPMIGLASLKPDPEATKAEQVALLDARASILKRNEDWDGAVRELKAAIDLSPEDFADPRVRLANIYMSRDRLDEAEPLFEETYAITPEHIGFLSIYQTFLYKRRKFDEGDKIGERIEELEGIYRRR